MIQIIPPKAKGGCLDIFKGWEHDVTSFSSYTGEARGLTFGMHNPHMDGSKSTDQIFDTLPRS